jgi:hypothetical protein
MSVLTYYAKRNLISGHVVDTQYSIEFDVRALDRRNMYDRRVHQSLGGATQTVFNREDVLWRLTTISLPRTGGEGTAEQFDEFASSVCAGETFTFDPYGTIAVPDSLESCMLRSNNISRVRLGALERYRYTFEFLVIS